MASFQVSGSDETLDSVEPPSSLEEHRRGIVPPAQNSPGPGRGAPVRCRSAMAHMSEPSMVVPDIGRIVPSRVVQYGRDLRAGVWQSAVGSAGPVTGSNPEDRRSSRDVELGRRRLQEHVRVVEQCGLLRSPHELPSTAPSSKATPEHPARQR
jgi:hypothetical protein